MAPHFTGAEIDFLFQYMRGKLLEGASKHLVAAGLQDGDPESGHDVSCCCLLCHHGVKTP